MADDNRKPASDRDAAMANDKGRMGPGEHAGGYGSQRFDPDHHGGSYGGNESAGGSYSEQPGRRAIPVRGQRHMSGRYGDQAYGRVDGSSSSLPRDPSQQQGAIKAAGGAEPADTGQNAQMNSGSPSPVIGAGQEDERSAPGISTDKRSDDTKPRA